MPFFVRRAMHHADAVIFISESTRKDAERLIPGGRVVGVVIPHGVDPRYTVQTSPKEVCAALERLHLSRPFILNVGTVEPRKNLLRLIHAFNELADHRHDICLVLAGKLGWHYSEILAQINGSRHAKRIHQVGFITDDEKRALLNSCEVFVYPSLYEGFGLPVLEAMAAGAPVITSTNSSLAEVAGDAAELVDPASIPDLSNAIAGLLADEAKKNRLRAAGKSRSSLFTWADTARNTYCLYRRLNSNLSNL